MKYTVELTKEEANVICDIISAIRNNSLLDHILFENTALRKVDEETIDYKLAYQAGVEAGNKIADKDLKEIQDSTYDVAYNKGLEEGYEGYRYLKQWFAHSYSFEDENILFPEYKRREANTCCLEDIIADVGLAKVLKRAKAHEEKKKAEEEIKVGDELKYINSERTIIVTRIYNNSCFDGVNSDGAVYCNRDLKLWNKTGRHIDEVDRLFAKLRGEANDNN